MRFFCISKEAAIISLISINRQVFVVETECIPCEVRTESISIKYFLTHFNCERLTATIRGRNYESRANRPLPPVACRIMWVKTLSISRLCNTHGRAID